MLKPKTVLIATLGVVGASTALLHAIPGYGTILSQGVVLGAWVIVAAATSGMFADTHQAVIWPVAFLLNVMLFSIPAVIIWAAGINRWPTASSVVIMAWCAFYLTALFWLFPATDGP